MAKRSGHCLCGVCRFEVDLAQKDGAVEIGVCHCDMCRRFVGGPYFGVHLSSEVAFEGGDAVGVFSSSEWAERGFCRTCGSPLFWRLKGGGMTVLPAGLFDDQSGFRFASEIYVDHQPDYYAFAGERRRMTEAEVVAMFTSGSSGGDAS